MSDDETKEKEDETKEKEDEKDKSGYGEEDGKKDTSGYGGDDEPDDDEEIIKPAAINPFDEIEGLSDEESDDYYKFLKTKKLSRDQRDALLELKKSDVKRQQDHFKALQIKAQKEVRSKTKQWGSELRNDADFGGSDDNFNKSLKDVNKIMSEMFPNTVKNFETTKQALPPHLMKDLRKLAVKLYNNETEHSKGDKPVEKDNNRGTSLGDLGKLTHWVMTHWRPMLNGRLETLTRTLRSVSLILN